MRTAIFLGLFCIASAINNSAVFVDDVSSDSILLSIMFCVFIASDLFVTFIKNKSK